MHAMCWQGTQSLKDSQASLVALNHEVDKLERATLALEHSLGVTDPIGSSIAESPYNVADPPRGRTGADSAPQWPEGRAGPDRPARRGSGTPRAGERDDSAWGGQGVQAEADSDATVRRGSGQRWGSGAWGAPGGPSGSGKSDRPATLLADPSRDSLPGQRLR